MKKISFCFAMLALVFGTYSCDVARSAQNKTNREISKKTNKKIEDIFNKKKPAPDDKGGSGGAGDADGTNDNNDKPAEIANANRNKSDFIPGEKVIFMDSQRVEILGEFPSKWDLERGNVEVMDFENRNVIGFASGGTIFPLMDEKNYLPERFTIEFDCYFHNYGNEAYTVVFDNRKADVAIRPDMVQVAGHNVRAEVDNMSGWRHMELSFNKRSLKVYFDGERLYNLPNLKERPLNVKFKALSHGAAKGKPAMIKNIRIAEGGVPLYHRLVTDGEFVTNDIHFDYNKADIKTDSWAVLRQVADMMKEHPEVRLKIEGHTDSDGRDDYNLALSKKRALSVKNALVKEGIAPGRLQTVGYGEQKPIDTSNTPEAMALNRRVAFVLLR
ncbi:MAG TPA: OmpA family protein [Bacteroidetes bacterium]|nr:OmpA family protein [Bacteroidota bacterium]